MENTLFTKAAFDSLKVDVEKKERTIIIDIFIVIDGEKFEIYDLYDTMESVALGGHYVDNPEMAAMFKKYGIMSPGSINYSGERGPNYDAFMKIVRSHM